MRLFFIRNSRYITLFALVIFAFAFVNVSFAGPLTDKREMMDQQDFAFADKAGFEEGVSVGDVVGTAVQAFLGFMGVVFVVLMVVGGYKYMMARGNEEQVTEALDLIRRAIIGLIIVASAYAITYFVFTKIDWAGSGGDDNSQVINI